MASIPSRIPARLVAGGTTVLVLVGTAVAVVVALSAPAAAGTHAVMIENYAYAPAALTVDQGDTVTWTNHDSVQHDVMVTSGPVTFRSPMLSQGQSWSHTFTVAGASSYICSVHPDMRASVTVRAKVTTPAPRPTKSTSAPAVAPPKSTAPSPAHAPRGTSAKQATRKADRAAAAAAAPEAVATPASELATTPVASSTSTLDPLLLVAGASTAVMVFCLLLMVSRPVVDPHVVDVTPESD